MLCVSESAAYAFFLWKITNKFSHRHSMSNQMSIILFIEDRTCG